MTDAEKEEIERAWQTIFPGSPVGPPNPGGFKDMFSIGFTAGYLAGQQAVAGELDSLRASNEALMLCLDAYKWVPCAERMPRSSEDVLGWAPGYARPLVWAWYADHNCWSSPHGKIIADDPTHWKPLPLTPEQLEKCE